MKRTVRVLILTLMLVTSLSAGTLAIYSSTIDLAPVAVAAKRFVLGVNQGAQTEFDLKIGPGELVSYQFDVTNENTDGNVSEVDMDLLVEADFSAIRASLPDVEIRLMLRQNGQDVQVAQADAGGAISYRQASLFPASVATEKHFSLTFYWAGDTIPDALLTGNRIALPLTLYVKGVQHID